MWSVRLLPLLLVAAAALALFAAVPASAQNSLAFDSDTACEDRDGDFNGACVECLHDDKCIFCSFDDDGDKTERCVTRNSTNEDLCISDSPADDGDTEEGPNYEEKCPTTTLDSLFTLVLAILIFFMMLGMGATVSFRPQLDDNGVDQGNSLLGAAKNWKPVLLGFISQYAALPLVCFILALIFQLEAPLAVGLIILSCTPGGTTSQLWTYLSEGDVALSITMTFCSTVLAFLMLPLLTAFLTIPWNQEINILGALPSIFLSLLLVVIPVAIGATIKEYKPKVAYYVEKGGSIFGVLAIIAAITLGGIINSHMFRSGWQVYLLCFLVPFLGIGIGHILARCARQPERIARTISWETGIQNSSLTITIITFAFDQPVLSDVLLIPLLYSLTLFIDGFFIVLIYRFVFPLDKEELPPSDVEAKQSDQSASSSSSSSSEEAPPARSEEQDFTEEHVDETSSDSSEEDPTAEEEEQEIESPDPSGSSSTSAESSSDSF